LSAAGISALPFTSRNIVEGKEESWQEQYGADLVLLKATCDLGQLRTCYNDAEDNLSRITSLHRADQILGMRNTAESSLFTKRTAEMVKTVSVKFMLRVYFF